MPVFVTPVRLVDIFSLKRIFINTYSLQRYIHSRLWLIAFILVNLFACCQGATASSLALTNDEKLWIAEHPVIRTAGPRAFPPFHFVDDNGAYMGMAADYLRIIFEKAGLQFESFPDLKWSDALQRIQRREIDILSCAGKSEERSGYLLFTKPHLSFPLVVVNRTDSAFIGGIEDLYMQKVALTRGVVTYDWLVRDGVEFEPVFTDTMKDALKKVALGEADAAVQNLGTATYFIEHEGLANLKVAAPTPYMNYDLSIAVRSDWPELVTILNKALASMDQGVQSQIRQKWISVRYEHGVSLKDILMWISGSGLVVLIIVTVIYRWNRRLAGEIRERLKTEQEKEQVIKELQDALLEIKSLHGILPLCSYCKKIRNDAGEWEPVDMYIHNHSQADVSHSICPECLGKNFPDLNFAVERELP